MWRRTAVACFVTALVLAGALWVGQVMAQDAPPPGPGDRPPRDSEEMRQRMEQFRQQMSDRMREQLGASEDEWKIIQPRIEKVQTAQRQSRGGMFGGMGGMMRRGRGGDRGGDRAGPPRPEGADQQPQTEVEKATRGLQTLLENKEAKPDEIKAALKGLRDARAKAAEEVAAARKELLEVLTLQQEAQLVLMGILE